MELEALLDLQPIGNDSFAGIGREYPWGGLFGGHIVAQALRAAALTVDDDLLPHSLRAYFIRRGNNQEKVQYEVDRVRDGRSFYTRRVMATQKSEAILNLEASFPYFSRGNWSHRGMDAHGATVARRTSQPLCTRLHVG